MTVRHETATQKSSQTGAMFPIEKLHRVLGTEISFDAVSVSCQLTGHTIAAE